jgi:AcrR family transcriptional regulator
MGTEVPQGEGAPRAYLERGRAAQKQRTYQVLVDAARQELARGNAVTVESVAAVAGISRTTAYRYFTNHRELVAAAHPQIATTSLLSDPELTDPVQRLDAVMHAFIHDVTLAWEPQLRAALHLALAPRPRAEDTGTTDAGTLRQGRGIGWILDALEPMRATHPDVDVELLARAIRSASGIESLIWLTDVGGLTREAAAQVMHTSAMAILRDALRRSGT